MELIASLNEDEHLDNETINERGRNISKLENATPVVKEYETIIKMKKKRILNIAYRQGIIFKINM